MAVAERAKTFDAQRHVREMREVGYTIVEDYLDAGQLQAFRDGVAPYLGTHRGRNDFEGFVTERIYTLVGRGQVFEEIAYDPRLMAIVGAFLKPNFLLSACHAINIMPGETAQNLHSDDGFYLWPKPRPPLGISVIGAIDAFTEENGGTVMLPGSHTWIPPKTTAEANRMVREAERVPLEMPAGAIAVFPGTFIHGAGANRSKAPRLAYTYQYCEPWLRTQENFYLAIPRERVAKMPPALQSLLGYSITQPFLGMVTASHPAKTLAPDWTPAIVRQEAE